MLVKSNKTKAKARSRVDPSSSSGASPLFRPLFATHVTKRTSSTDIPRPSSSSSSSSSPSASFPPLHLFFLPTILLSSSSLSPPTSAPLLTLLLALLLLLFTLILLLDVRALTRALTALTLTSSLSTAPPSTASPTPSPHIVAHAALHVVLFHSVVSLLVSRFVLSQRLSSSSSSTSTRSTNVQLQQQQGSTTTTTGTPPRPTGGGGGGGELRLAALCHAVSVLASFRLMLSPVVGVGRTVGTAALIQPALTVIVLVLLSAAVSAARRRSAWLKRATGITSASGDNGSATNTTSTTSSGLVGVQQDVVLFVVVFVLFVAVFIRPPLPKLRLHVAHFPLAFLAAVVGPVVRDLFVVLKHAPAAAGSSISSSSTSSNANSGHTLHNSSSSSPTPTALLTLSSSPASATTTSATATPLTTTIRTTNHPRTVSTISSTSSSANPAHNLTSPHPPLPQASLPPSPPPPGTTTNTTPPSSLSPPSPTPPPSPPAPHDLAYASLSAHLLPYSLFFLFLSLLLSSIFPSPPSSSSPIFSYVAATTQSPLSSLLSVLRPAHTARIGVLLTIVEYLSVAVLFRVGLPLHATLHAFVRCVALFFLRRVFGSSAASRLYWHAVTSSAAVVLVLTAMGCVVLLALIVAVVTVVIVFAVRHVRQHNQQQQQQQQQQWQSSNNNSMNSLRSHHHHHYGKTSSAWSSLSSTQLTLVLAAALLFTLLTTLLLTTFAFLRSHYLSFSSSSSFLLSPDADMDDNLSLYGLRYGKIVRRFGKHRPNDDDGVSPMDIDVFSETNPNGQSFNSRYSLHALQRMQHSRYDDPAELARAATARAREMAQYHEPLLRAARNDLLPRDSEELEEKTTRRKRKRTSDAGAMSAANVVRHAVPSSSLSASDKNLSITSSSSSVSTRLSSPAAGQLPLLLPLSAVDVSRSRSRSRSSGNPLGAVSADSSLLLSGISSGSSSSLSSSASAANAAAPSAAFFHVVEHFYRPSSWTLVDLNSSSSSSSNMTLVSRQLPLAGFVDMPWQYATTARLVDLAPSRTRLCSIDHSPEHCIAKATFHHAHHVVVHLPLAEYLAAPHLAYVTRVREYARDAHVARVVVPGLGVPARARPKRRANRSGKDGGTEQGKEDDEEEEERLDEETETAVKKLHGLPVDLLVRGERTRAMLHRAGFGIPITDSSSSSSITYNNKATTNTNSHVHVVGCPSFFLPDDLHLGRKWGNRLRTLAHLDSSKHKQLRILFSMRAFRGYYSVVRALVRAYGHRVSFAAQTAWDLRNLHEIGVLPSVNAVRVPATPEQWMSVLSEVDVVLAGRVQIAMIAAMYGTPGVAVVADEAAAEMVEAMHVPFVTAAELVDMASAEYNEAAGNRSNSVHTSNSNRTGTVPAAAMDVRELVKKALATRVVVVGATAVTAAVQPKTAREEDGINNKNSTNGSVTGRRRNRVTQRYKWSEAEMDDRRCAIAKTYVQVYARVGLHVMAHVRNVADSC